MEAKVLIDGEDALTLRPEEAVERRENAMRSNQPEVSLGLPKEWDREFPKERTKSGAGQANEEHRTAILADPDGSISAEKGPWGRFGVPGRDGLAA